ncbi:MAG: hypothetical protein JWO94_2983 [Verrucomicrobiaceae bacterium]|nr:hypothetical protein [Verrucomicrobiaceae bacterium]
MNDPELETLLRSMTPAAPSAELAGRVRHDLDLINTFREAAPANAPVARARPAPWMAPLVWAGLGAAAAVIAMSVVHPQMRATAGNVASSSSVTRPLSIKTASAPATAAGAVMPVSSTREWVDVEDMGISFATPDSPAREMKVISMERHQWIDPRDGAEYTVEVPKEESVVLPMKYQ